MLKDLADINNSLYDNLQIIQSKDKEIFIHDNVSYTASLFYENMESMRNIEKNFEIIKSAFATKNIEINLYKFDKRFKTFI